MTTGATGEGATTPEHEEGVVLDQSRIDQRVEAIENLDLRGAIPKSVVAEWIIQQYRQFQEDFSALPDRPGILDDTVTRDRYIAEVATLAGRAGLINQAAQDLLQLDQPPAQG